MITDLHIHSIGSDGKLSVQEIFKEAVFRNIGFMSITDHDSIRSQTKATEEANASGIQYISGLELNVTFSHSKYKKDKPISLDFLGYQFEVDNKILRNKLEIIAKYRKERGDKILDKVNAEFQKNNITTLTEEDFIRIEQSVDGSFGRPHIADYLIKKGIVKNRQEAFDKYLLKCDVKKFPLHIEEASKIIRAAGGKLILAHPNDPYGTSLVSLTNSLSDQTEIIKEKMLPYIDGIECWHSRNTTEATNHYVDFARKQGLIMTGGSDCHQKPIIMGTVHIPDWLVNQFA